MVNLTTPVYIHLNSANIRKLLKSENIKRDMKKRTSDAAHERSEFRHLFHTGKQRTRLHVYSTNFHKLLNETAIMSGTTQLN